MADNIIELMNESPVDKKRIFKSVENMNTVDIADAFERLSKEKVIQLFRLLPKSMAAEVFSFIEPENQQIIIEALSEAEAGKIIEDLYVDDAVDFIEEMLDEFPANVVNKLLRNVSEDTRTTINQLLQYPEDSAGSIMTTEYVYLREDVTVEEAFNLIRKTGLDKETIYTCYVIMRDRLLVGVVSVKTLLLSKLTDKIGDIMDTNLISAQTHDDQEEIAALFRKYGLLSLPIVDKEQRLVGIVTVDDIVLVIEEETTEDIEKMHALKPSEEPYFKTGILRHSGNRIVWLMVLMLSATVTAYIIGSFEDAIAVLPVLSAFIPVLMDTAGNSGCQTSALIIRGLALGEINPREIFKSLWIEVRVGILCGVVLGVANFLRMLITNRGDYMLALTVSLAMIATVIISKSVGCVLPLIAKKIKVDPAIMAAPLITSIADALALIVYFYLAVSLLDFGSAVHVELTVPECVYGC